MSKEQKTPPACVAQLHEVLADIRDIKAMLCRVLDKLTPQDNRPNTVKTDPGFFNRHPIVKTSEAERS